MHRQQAGWKNDGRDLVPLRKVFLVHKNIQTPEAANALLTRPAVRHFVKWRDCNPTQVLPARAGRALRFASAIPRNILVHVFVVVRNIPWNLEKTTLCLDSDLTSR